MLSVERQHSAARARLALLAAAVAVLLIAAATAAGRIPYLSVREVRLSVPHTCPDPPIIEVFGRTWQGHECAPPSWVPAVRGEFRILSLNRASFTADGHRGAMDFSPMPRFFIVDHPLQ